MNVDSLINLAIFIVCLAVSFTVVCRLNAMHRRTKSLFRLKYALLLGGSLAGGVSPLLFPEHPRIGGLIFALTVLVYLVLGFQAWRGGAPDYTECKTDRLPFDPMATAEFLAKRSKR